MLDNHKRYLFSGTTESEKHANTCIDMDDGIDLLIESLDDVDREAVEMALDDGAPNKVEALYMAGLLN